MSNESNMRRVTAIRNGTVIDHIPAGSALRVLELLNIGKGASVPVSLVMNVPSKKKGAKDIVKVEDRELTQAELDRLALVAEGASVAIIRAYSVAEKLEIALGDEIVDVVRAPSRIASRKIRGSLWPIVFGSCRKTHFRSGAIIVAGHRTLTNWCRTSFEVDQITHLTGLAHGP